MCCKDTIVLIPLYILTINCWQLVILQKYNQQTHFCEIS